MMEARWSARRVTRQLGRSDCVVRRFWNQCHLLATPSTDQSSRRPPHPEWYQVVFSDESRVNLSSVFNRVRARRPHGEHLNPEFALQPHTVHIAGVMVWCAIAYNTRLPLVLIRGTMTAQRYVNDILQPMCYHSCNGSQEPFCNKTTFDLTLPGGFQDSLCNFITLLQPA
ncbi:transposable element Tcb1 transposase [Trichonephila clavipes]|nr:transposable element Tcb1 transposase [Trichonephila clavipes]